VGRGVGTREMLVVLGIAAAGLILAGLAALTGWYQRPAAPHAPVVEIIAPERTPADAVQRGLR
jgi:hypothetical protein